MMARSQKRRGGSLKKKENGRKLEVLLGGKRSVGVKEKMRHREASKETYFPAEARENKKKRGGHGGKYRRKDGATQFPKDSGEEKLGKPKKKRARGNMEPAQRKGKRKRSVCLWKIDNKNQTDEEKKREGGREKQAIPFGKASRQTRMPLIKRVC